MIVDERRYVMEFATFLAVWRKLNIVIIKANIFRVRKWVDYTGCRVLHILVNQNILHE